MEGGKSKNGKYNFSNPGMMELIAGGRNEFFSLEKILIIKEDITGISNDRNPSHIKNYENKINEAYWVKAPLTMDENYSPIAISIDDLNLFMIGPKGSVIKGGSGIDPTFSREKTGTYFAAIQNSNESNNNQENKSMVIAVTGFWNIITDINFKSKFEDKNSFKIWPNPASRILYFNKQGDISVYNSQGILLKNEKNVLQIDISGMEQGIYFLVDHEKTTHKIIVE